MRNLLLYILSAFVIFTSCINEVEDLSLYQVDGMWASVNEDATMNGLIEFKDGAYKEYFTQSEVKFYHNNRLWNTRIEELNQKVYQYSIVDGKLLLNGTYDKSISVSRDTLYIGTTMYQFVEDLVPEYCSSLNLPLLDGGTDFINISSSAQDIILDYEVSDIPKSNYLAVSVDVDWIHSLEVDAEKIKFSVDENLTSEERWACLTLYHPACGIREVFVCQPFTIYPVSVKTLEPEDVSYTSVTLKGTILDLGKGQLMSCGFCCSADENSLIRCPVDYHVGADMELRLTDLKSDVTYYCVAYAENETGVSYGDLVKFKTFKFKVPSVQTNDAADITISSAIVSGSIVEDGGSSIRERGFYYGLSADSLTKHIVTSSNDSFSCRLNYLNDGSTYYYQTYAVNSTGEGLGELKTFQTVQLCVPTVKTNTVSEITPTAAMLHGEILDEGGAEIQKRGFYYGESSVPSKGGSVTYVYDLTNSFSATLSKLAAGKVYYCQAFAVNKKGEGLGEVVSFKTKAATTPTLITKAATDIKINSATLNAEITYNGGADITTRGFYYGKNPYDMSKISLGTGSGAFSCSISSLDPGTLYYYKAYASNSEGVVFGEILSFVTNDYEYVDLGLPSGTLWSTMNIGASAPEEGGLLFQWGCVEPGNQGNPLSTYTKSISGTQYDAAKYHMGGSWTVPTRTQAGELFRYCTYSHTTINGMKCTVLTSSRNGNTLILPSDKGYWTGDYGTYFSDSYFYAVFFSSYGFSTGASCETSKGVQLHIRAVRY